MDCHSLLQGIFLTLGLNPGLLHYRQIFLPSEPPGKPLTRNWYDVNVVAQGTCPACEKHLLFMSFLNLKTTCFSLEYNVKAAVQLSLIKISQCETLAPSRWGPLSL